MASRSTASLHPTISRECVRILSLPSHVAALGSSLLLLAAPALAGDPISPIRILTFNELRSYPCGESSYAFATGIPHEAARASLADPAHFGPGGIIERATTLLEPVTFLDAKALVGTDILFVNSLVLIKISEDESGGIPLGGTLLTAEQSLLASFVEQGGGVLVFTNQGTDQVRDFLGCSATTGCGPGVSFFANLAHPVLSGPFGQLSGLFSFVFQCRTADLGSFGVALAEADLPVAAAFEFGKGRVVVVNDDEWIMNVNTGCAAFRQWSEDDETLMLNAVAWMLPREGFEFDPDGCPFPVEDLNCDGVVNGADLGILLSDWGPCVGCQADFNGDGEVNGGDIGILLAAWSDAPMG